MSDAYVLELEFNFLPDLYEGEFTCKTLKQIGMKAKPHVKRIIKLIQGGGQ